MTSSSYRLYGRANAGSLAVQIVLEEIGAPYELNLGWQNWRLSLRPCAASSRGKVPASCYRMAAGVQSAASLIHLTTRIPQRISHLVAGSTALSRFDLVPAQWSSLFSCRGRVHVATTNSAIHSAGTIKAGSVCRCCRANRCEIRCGMRVVKLNEDCGRLEHRPCHPVARAPAPFRRIDAAQGLKLSRSSATQISS